MLAGLYNTTYRIADMHYPLAQSPGRGEAHPGQDGPVQLFTLAAFSLARWWISQHNFSFW